MTRLAAENLTVRFGGRAVLEEVGAAVEPGQLVGLIGPNAAGKTTLVRALAGLQSPAHGAVTLDGRPLSGVSHRERARTIAYLPQGADAHWPVAVERIVALGRHPHLESWQRPSAADRAAIEQAMFAAGVTHLATRPVSRLSAGERARAMLARALAGEPRILLADEPVAQLDPYHQIQVMELFRMLAREGLGVLVVLHDLTLAARFCDRLMALHEGRIAAEGDPRAVLTPKLLSQVYGVVAEIGTRGDDLFVVPLRRIEAMRPEAEP
jgi:iron complex transport system ATP-binding protein